MSVKDIIPLNNYSIPSLQGTLANRTKLTLRPKFTKEPFSPSHAKMIETCNKRDLNDMRMNASVQQ